MIHQFNAGSSITRRLQHLTIQQTVVNSTQSSQVCANLSELDSAAAMVQISEVKGNSRENRTAAHTHIKGLGLRSDGYAEKTGAGFVGQAAAREVRSDPFKKLCH